MSIPVEFPGRLCQCGHGQVIHGWQYPPKILGTLRHDYDRLDLATIGTDGRANAYVGLQQAVAAAFAGTMKSQNHRPLSVRSPIFRNEYLVFVRNRLDGKSAVDEPCLMLFGLRWNREQWA